MSGLLSVRTPQNRKHLEPLNQVLSDPQICGSQALVMVAEYEGWPVLPMDAVCSSPQSSILEPAVAKLQLQNWKGYANLIPAWSLANQTRTAPAVFSVAHHTSYNCGRPASVCNTYYCSPLHQSRELRLACASGEVAKREIIY